MTDVKFFVQVRGEPVDFELRLGVDTLWPLVVIWRKMVVVKWTVLDEIVSRL